MSADGDIVAFTTFDSTYGANPDGQGEVVVYNVVADSHNQITVTPNVAARSLSGAGAPTSTPQGTRSPSSPAATPTV